MTAATRPSARVRFVMTAPDAGDAVVSLLHPTEPFGLGAATLPDLIAIAEDSTGRSWLGLIALGWRLHGVEALA